MHPFLLTSVIVLASWLTFFIYWMVSAVGVKRNVSGTGTWQNWAIGRIAFVVVVIVALNLSWLNGFWAAGEQWPLFQSLTAHWIGAILVVAGVSFAIWARRHLGRNWSGTPRMKVDHELVTSGPYSFVRHPIYTGMLTALFGSALVAGLSWFFVFVIFTGMFIWRIRVEERYMMELFPTQYPAYRVRTKALVPFIW